MSMANVNTSARSVGRLLQTLPASSIAKTYDVIARTYIRKIIHNGASSMAVRYMRNRHRAPISRGTMPTHTRIKSGNYVLPDFSSKSELGQGLPFGAHEMPPVVGGAATSRPAVFAVALRIYDCWLSLVASSHSTSLFPDSSARRPPPVCHLQRRSTFVFHGLVQHLQSATSLTISGHMERVVHTTLRLRLRPCWHRRGVLHLGAELRASQLREERSIHSAHLKRGRIPRTGCHEQARKGDDARIFKAL